MRPGGCGPRMVINSRPRPEREPETAPCPRTLSSSARPRRVDRRHLCCAGATEPAGFPGQPVRRGQPPERHTPPGATRADHRGRELPELARRRHPAVPQDRAARGGPPLLGRQGQAAADARHQRPRTDGPLPGAGGELRHAHRVEGRDRGRLLVAAVQADHPRRRGDRGAHGDYRHPGRGRTTSACRARTATRTTASAPARSATGRCRGSRTSRSRSSAAATARARRRAT